MEKNEFHSELTVLLEPTGACNLRCRHCYHAKTDYDPKKMSAETLDRFLAVTAPRYKKVKIIWHGGEPLLAGYNFFVKAYELFDRYAAKYGVKFDFNIQTNGTLLDENFIRLFQKTDTTVSVSFDGEFNDVLRQETEKVNATINLLKERGVKFACLSAISSASVKHLEELYEYFKAKGIQAKFNPLLPDGAANENVDFLLTKEDWAENFAKLFRLWFFDTDCNIYLASCCDILAKYLGLMGYGCLSGTCMFRYIAVDAYGDLYPCGRLIEKNFLLGNVYEITDIRQAYLSESYGAMLEKNKRRANKCKACKWFGRCHSGCNASANLSGDMSAPFDFECYFTRKAFEAIEEILKNYDVTKINKYAREILQKAR